MADKSQLPPVSEIRIENARVELDGLHELHMGELPRATFRLRFDPVQASPLDGLKPRAFDAFRLDRVLFEARLVLPAVEALARGLEAEDDGDESLETWAAGKAACLIEDTIAELATGKVEIERLGALAHAVKTAHELLDFRGVKDGGELQDRLAALCDRLASAERVRDDALNTIRTAHASFGTYADGGNLADRASALMQDLAEKRQAAAYVEATARELRGFVGWDDKAELSTNLVATLKAANAAGRIEKQLADLRSTLAEICEAAGTAGDRPALRVAANIRVIRRELEEKRRELAEVKSELQLERARVTLDANPGARSIVLIDPTTAEREAAVRDALIARGWTPPPANLPSRTTPTEELEAYAIRATGDGWKLLGTADALPVGEWFHVARKAGPGIASEFVRLPFPYQWDATTRRWSDGLGGFLSEKQHATFRYFRHVDHDRTLPGLVKVETTYGVETPAPLIETGEPSREVVAVKHGTEEGDRCNRNGCTGTLKLVHDGEGCSCHISPPCSYHESARPACDTCDFDSGAPA